MEWSQVECNVIVVDYLDMLHKELKGEGFSKAEHRRSIIPNLNGRTEGSVEYKYQNISAVLNELGYPYIPGYKPASNYQQLLKEVIESLLSSSMIERSAELLIEEPVQNVISVDWARVLSEPPEIQKGNFQRPVRDFVPKKYNFSEIESRNRALGLKGEQFILEFERYRLANAGREDLVKDIEWTSDLKGDGAGYDIRSFNPSNDQELFIEVKTTKLGKYLPFFISSNEVEFSREHKQNYSLYRVYDFRDSPKLFMLDGDVSESVNLEANNYKANFN